MRTSLFLLAIGVALFVVAGRLVAAGSSSSSVGRIAFSAGPHGHEDVYVVNADGTGLRQLTTDPAADFDPSWSPDGKRIAYRHETNSDSTSEIYVMNDDGSHRRNVTRRAGQDHSPAWSPDGKKIAFASVRRGLFPAIWVMSADGSHQRRLSKVDGEYPAWSPDGKKIAFDRNTFGPSGWDIWVMNADGTGAQALLHSAADEKGAAWSPNRKWIAFGSGCEGLQADRLWIARLDGTRRRRLTSVPAERPDWSPDGSRIVFTAGGLTIVRADGTELRELPLGSAVQPVLADWIG